MQFADSRQAIDAELSLSGVRRIRARHETIADKTFVEKKLPVIEAIGD